MLRRSQRGRLSLITCLSGALIVLTVQAALPQSMTADQIIEKNIAARGGLKAWRSIQTMTMSGKMDAGGKPNVQLPFVMKMKRPRMLRIEIEFAGKTALQVYDGTNGWKVRPFLGRNEVEPFTPAEMESFADNLPLDGCLIDHEAKGIQVELAGEEKVEGRNSYKLKITTKEGRERYLWVDAESFLEIKIEGTPRRLDGKMHKVEVYYRNYAPVSGLTMPFALETVVENVKLTRKINIEKVLLNPQLDDLAFAKPEITGESAAVIPKN
jgi:hypothetical protein